MKHYIFIILICMPLMGYSQKERTLYQPYVDDQPFHFGFCLGVNFQDLQLIYNELNDSDNKWFAAIPAYRPGFSLGIIADKSISSFFNIRFTPAVHIGSKQICFKELSTGVLEYETLTSAFLFLPVDVKFSSLRIKNYRPYLIGGLYGSYDCGRKKEGIIKARQEDWGFSVGIGVDFYRSYFKWCPEIRFYFGLRDIWDNAPAVEPENNGLRQSVRKSRNRLFTLVFNFE